MAKKRKSTTPKQEAERTPCSTVTHVAAIKANTASLPAAARIQTDLRALMLFNSLPESHGAFRVDQDRAAPHLHKGEYAVVDLNDRELQHGELYVIQHQSGERPRDLVQITSSLCNITGPDAEESLVWWCGDLRSFRKTDETVLGCPVFAGLSDGPYQDEHLQKKLLGRVVGFAYSPLGSLTEPEAGWQDEAAGNAAFDPGEYLDTLIAAGWRPSICGSMYYEATPDRRVSKAHDEAVLAVRWKYVAASTTLVRVKQECIRRGLVDDRRAQ